MHQTNLDKHCLRSTLLLGVASVATIGFSAQALAQAQATETVVVTGSRIPQQGLYAPSPVTSIGQQEFKLQGTTSVENLLNTLPQVFGDQSSSVSNAASGTASVDLRDLGPKRTLVLVNGNRLMPGDPDALTHGTSGTADLNIIPVALIDHVEILTGGASAVYGSDAVAGVVNFIMRKDFEGVELDGQYSVTENANNKFDGLLTANDLPIPEQGIFNGGTTNLSMLLGANGANGRANVTMYATFFDQQKVLESTRDYSTCGATTTFSGGFACTGSSTIPQGRFIAVDRNAASLTDPTLAFGSKGFVPTDTGTFIPFTNQSFDFAPFNYIQRPDVRYTMGAFGHYEVNKQFDVYSELMFMDDHTLAQVAPGGAFQTPFLINCDNPLLSAQQSGLLCPTGAPALNLQANGCATAAGCTFGSPGVTEATVLVGRRAVESGPRIDDLRHTQYRIVIGAKGDLGDGWSYDVHGQYGSTIYGDAQEGFWSNSRVEKALQVLDVGGVPTCKSVIDQSDPACVPLNIFNTTPGTLTKDMLNYITVPGISIGETIEQVLNATATGDLGPWGGQSPWAKNPIAVSVGAEYRQEELTFTPDEELLSGDLGGLGGPRPPAHGRYDVSEGFAEVKIPLVQNMPYAEDLTVNAGYRYSSYNISGSTNTYKYGLEWQPVDDIRLRASYDRAVRAPNTTELFTNQAIILFGGQDPCANSATTNASPFVATNPNALSAKQIAGCLASGVKVAQEGTILPCPASQCQQQISGNINLTPEIADTRTVGFVFTPTFFDGFTATVDWFDIKVSRVIGAAGANFLLNQCINDLNLVACANVHRDPTTGFIWTGNGFISNPTTNLGFIKTRGADFEANYASDMDSWGLWRGYGSVAFNFIGTWTKNLITEPAPPNSPFFNPDAPTYDCAGKFGLICSAAGTELTPKWRHKLRVTWTTPWDFDFSLQWRFISGVSFDGNNTNPNLNDGLPFDHSDATINDFNYLDVAVDWNVSSMLTLRAGVNNITDKDPPFLDSNNIGISGPPFGNGNTFPEVYDPLGRFLFVNATVKW